MRQQSAARAPLAQTDSHNVSSPLTIELLNQRSEIARLAAFAERFGREHHLSDDDTANLQLVLDEMVINIILHGYEDAGDTRVHTIPITLQLHNGLLTIRIEDDARPYDPTSAPEPRFDLPLEERTRGGLGVHIVKSIMDTMDYRRDNERNVVTLTKHISK